MFLNLNYFKRSNARMYIVFAKGEIPKELAI